mmetsp:Transcript_27119/g.49488  ORF Transcript_27119/g.49488 Transcript_27119/m.49488 type:complete len:150 (+) Transcript_27119:212-661(+)
MPDRHKWLCRVVVGRVLDEAGKTRTNTPAWHATSHSEMIGKDFFACRGTCLVYPEYVITYRDHSSPAAAAAPATPTNAPSPRNGRSASKMCIICLENPVKFLTIPCGHPCLCEKCNSPQIKARLNYKCPECRCRFKSTAIIYGRVVNDE